MSSSNRPQKRTRQDVMDDRDLNRDGRQYSVYSPCLAIRTTAADFTTDQMQASNPGHGQTVGSSRPRTVQSSRSSLHPAGQSSDTRDRYDGMPPPPAPAPMPNPLTSHRSSSHATGGPGPMARGTMMSGARPRASTGTAAPSLPAVGTSRSNDQYGRRSNGSGQHMGQSHQSSRAMTAYSGPAPSSAERSTNSRSQSSSSKMTGYHNGPDTATREHRNGYTVLANPGPDDFGGNYTTHVQQRPLQQSSGGHLQANQREVESTGDAIVDEVLGGIRDVLRPRPNADELGGLVNPVPRCNYNRHEHFRANRYISFFENDVDLVDSPYQPVAGGLVLEGTIRIVQNNAGNYAAMAFDEQGSRVGWIMEDNDLLRELDGSTHYIVAAVKWIDHELVGASKNWVGIVSWRARMCQTLVYAHLTEA
ncbi:hypothetical protein BJ508DRAFT_332799 [Ascobolus immersus RN42]|uniref:Uncharacterized protein n=1 Tax=Ascobolus immersus RN42 TaxID=1160509 RepID=A0A3N4HSF4_ASCIM|nr:hypothetical protein BJ508DRAFT_332799 [Ascobolus immersus RN42]